MSPVDPYRSPQPVEADREPPPPEDFGALRTTHDALPQLARRRAYLVAAGVCSVILFGVLVNAKPGALAPAGNVVLCLSAFIVIGMLFRRSMPPPAIRIAVFAQGVAITYPNGAWAKLTFQAVDEVWYVRKGLRRIFRLDGSYAALRLVTRSGRSLELPLAVHDADAVFRAVHVACTQPLVAEAERALDRGEELTFGRVRLDRRAIVVGGVPHPWSEIEATFHAGYVVLDAGARHIATVGNDAVPHPRLFAHLVRRAAAKLSNADPRQGSTW